MKKKPPDNKQELLQETARLLRRRISRIRYRCLTDLYFLTRQVLGYKALTPRIHKPLCQVIQAVNPYAISLAGPSCTLDKPVMIKGIGLIEPWTQLMTEQEVTSRADDQHEETSDNLGNRGAGGGGVCLSTSTQNSIKILELDADTSFLGDLGRYTYWKPEAKERGFFLFRGSFKTTIISVAHTIQLMLLWPDIRILINSHKKEGGSQEILGAIKRHFVANQLLRTLFPEACPKANATGVIEWGTTEKITAVNRSAGCAWPEATVEIAGLTTDVTGRHYDYIKNDDLVTRDSVTNETMIAKTRQFKALQKFLFNQPEWGITDNVGTFYHFADLNVTLSKSDKITRITLPAVKDDQLPPEQWEPLVPERFTPQGLYDIKTDPTMSSFDWSAQYMMNPVPPEDQTFKPEWLERLGFYYEPSELPQNMRVEIYVDPASKRRKKSDYTAIMVVGFAEDGTKYILDMLQDKLGTEARTNLALDIARKWKRHRLHYETIGFQDTDKYIIEKKAREQKWPISIEEIGASNASKEDRIKGLQPLYERFEMRWPKKLIYHSTYEGKNLDMIEILRDQLLMFPRLEHDDLIDCHSMMLRNSEILPGKRLTPAEEDNAFSQMQKLVKEQRLPQDWRHRQAQNTASGLQRHGKTFSIPAKKAFR